MRDVVLHAFNWPYATIAAHAQQIADCGYGAVLFPPPLYSDENGGAWWQSYQPKDYRVLRSHLGRKADLLGALAALRDVGVRAYADVVFNHMANEKTERQARGETDLYNFPGAYQRARYQNERTEFMKDWLYGNLDDGLFSDSDFNPAGDIKDWLSAEGVEEGWLGGLPDLHLTDWVVDQQSACLRALNALGFSGYRIDAMKHLPVEHLTRVFGSDAMRDRFVFGEVLTTDDNEEAVFLWPVVHETQFPCYDFALHHMLRRALAPTGTLRELVDPAAHGQALPWNRAVTFTVTHDIPNNAGFRGLLLDSQDEYLANAYIVGRDGGVPLVYSDHNESAYDHPSDRDRWAESWSRYDIVQMIGFHNAVQGQPQRCLYEADGFLVLARGDSGIVAINKTEDWQNPTISTWGLRQGRYHCQIHQCDMDVQGENFGFAIPPRQAQLWLHAGA